MNYESLVWFRHTSTPFCSRYKVFMYYSWIIRICEYLFPRPNTLIRFWTNPSHSWNLRSKLINFRHFAVRQCRLHLNLALSFTQSAWRAEISCRLYMYVSNLAQNRQVCRMSHFKTFSVDSHLIPSQNEGLRCLPPAHHSACWPYYWKLWVHFHEILGMDSSRYGKHRTRCWVWSSNTVLPWAETANIAAKHCLL